MISYKPFFKMIERKGITQYDLENRYLISKGTMDSLRNNRNITLLTLESICEMLECGPLDVFEFVKEE